VQEQKNLCQLQKTFFYKKKVINNRLNYLSIILDDASDPPGHRVNESIQQHNAEVLVAQAAVAAQAVGHSSLFSLPCRALILTFLPIKRFLLTLVVF
jgi:hypothetical protein